MVSECISSTKDVIEPIIDFDTQRIQMIALKFNL